MHLVYAIDVLTSGGAQRQVVELALRLAKNPELRVTLLSYPGPNFYEARLEGSEVEIVQLEKGGRFDVGYVLRLRRWLTANRADLVHAFMLGPIFWCYAATRGLERPVVVPAERNVLRGVARGVIELKRWIYRASPCVTANSEVAAAEIVRLGVSRERVACLPNAIDVEAWDRAAEPEPAVTPDSQRFQLALIGRRAPQKNHVLVLDALERLGAEAEGLRVWFVGDSRTHPQLAMRIRDEIVSRGLGDVVRMLPPMQDLAAFLARLDGLLIPSSREGFPNVALEAMSLRVPVIAAPAGELPLMLDQGKAGLLLDRTTADDLAQAIRRLRAMPASERDQIARRGRERVESHYAIEVVAQRHLELYRRLCADRDAR